MKYLVYPLFVFVIPSPAPPPCHFSVRLEMTVGKNLKTVEVDAPDLLGRLPERPVLELKAGEEISFRWSVSALEKNSTTYKDLTVHVFVTAEKELGQARPPAQDENTLFESALFMDFPPKGTAKGDIRLKIEDAGLYLVRVETLGLADIEAHEHGAQLDLKVASREAQGSKP